MQHNEYTRISQIFLADKLEEKKEEEVQSKLFTEVPNKHYMELTQLLLKQ